MTATGTKTSRPGSGRRWLLTRFNVQVHEGSTRHLEEDWLRSRWGYFHQYTAPSVASQVHDANLRWIVFCDTKSPSWLIGALATSPGNPEVVFTEGVFQPEVGRDHLLRLGYRAGLTTRLDSDDVFLEGFLRRVQRSVAVKGHGVHTLPLGYQQLDDRYWLRCYVQNPFISLQTNDERTVFDLRRWDLAGEPVHVIRSGPAWTQIIHGSNLANEIRGIRIRGAGSTGVGKGWRADSSTYRASRKMVQGVHDLLGPAMNSIPRLWRVWRAQPDERDR